MSANKGMTGLELEVNTLHVTAEAIDCVRQAYLTAAKESGLSKRELADLIERDPSYVSRILNGRAANVNFQTLARMLLAMNYWPILQCTPMSEINHLGNYCHREVVSDDYPRATAATWSKYREVESGSKVEPGSRSETGNISPFVRSY